MRRERDVKERIKEILDEMGAWWFMYVPVGYGKSGIPDFLVCYQGHFIAIEAKYGDNRPTALQKAQMVKIEEADGITMVIDEHTVEVLREWIEKACS